MADSIQRSFESMSIQRPGQGSGPQQNPYLTNGMHSSLNGTLSSNGSTSIRSPIYGNAHLPFGPMSGAEQPQQSAAARFEQFFNTGNSNGSPPGLDTGLHSMGFPNHPQLPQHGSASIGPGSSAAGLASNGSFGSFGHNFQANAGPPFLGPTSSLPALRSKPSNIRQGFPSQWNAMGGEDLTNGLDAGSSPTPHFASLAQPQQYYGVAGPSSAFGMGSANLPSSGALGSDEDIIPTAIVVKNIPFSIKREQLLQIIEELNIPMPYAFNYHFDQGVFRGLAFANFRSGEEADAVVAALNGFDVSGRKLRVEYKKVLQTGEKERIEKEKAIKRMQSMQMEKERVRRQTVSSNGTEDWAYGQGSGASNTSGGTAPTKMPFGPGTELDSGYGDAYGEAAGAAPTSTLASDMFRSSSDSQSELAADAAAELGGRKDELDLNDPATLEIYSRVLLFKDDRMRDELSFSKSLTMSERRIVHLVSKKLNLYHYSLGEGEERHVIVTKSEVNQPAQRTLRTQASIIGRTGRMGDANSLASANGYTSVRNAALRTKKSAPDMKRQRERSEDGAFGMAGAYGFVNGSLSHGPSGGAGGSLHSTFGPGGLSRKSNGNLREGYSASSFGRRSIPTNGINNGAASLQNLFSAPFDIPPVPALPTNLAGEAFMLPTSTSPSPIGTSSQSNGSLASLNQGQNVIRQPAGPGTTNRNFAQRSRVPIGSGIVNGAGFASSFDGSNGRSTPATASELEGSIQSSGPGDLREDDVQTHPSLEV